MIVLELDERPKRPSTLRRDIKQIAICNTLHCINVLFFNGAELLNSASFIKNIEFTIHMIIY